MTVNMLWIYFRADDILSANLFIRKLFSFKEFTIREDIVKCFDLMEFRLIEEKVRILHKLTVSMPGIHMWLFVSGAFLVVLLCKNCRELKFKPTVTTAAATTVFFVWSVLSFTEISEFLYFGF